MAHRYVGEWREGLADGYGVLQTATGERWEGMWRGGMRHGRGVAVSDSGTAEAQTWEVGGQVPTAHEMEPQPCAGAAPIRHAAVS